MNEIVFGQAVVRREDERLISGRGRYADDVSLPGLLRAVFVRSPYPAAAIRSIDASAALAQPNVIAVFTAADLAVDGVKDWSIPAKLAKVGGGFSLETAQTLLARGVVRYAGEPVAMVIAATLAEAMDAAELVVVDYEERAAVLNPLLAEGQVQGGVAQGIGQALLEEIRHQDGQLVTGSFMDYAMPRASDLPRIVGENLEIPTAVNPLGVKGVGEAGTVGGLAAAMNAICNALLPAGIRHIDMPTTPLRVWTALRDARTNGE